jgi:hypothetical protein
MKSMSGTLPGHASFGGWQSQNLFRAAMQLNSTGRNQSSAQAWESTGYEGQKTLNSREQNAHRVIFQQVRGALGWLRPPERNLKVVELIRFAGLMHSF